MASASRLRTDPHLPAALLNAIGEPEFGGSLLAFLWEGFRVEHYTAFMFRDGRPTAMLSRSIDGTDTAHRQTTLYLDGQHWRRDPTMIAARRGLGASRSQLHQLDVSTMPHNALRDTIYGTTDICERVLMVGQAGSITLGLSVLRSNQGGHFAKAELDELGARVDELIALLGRHARFASCGVDLSIALSSLPEIERAIAAAPEHMPRREAEVCARILYGISSIGMSCDLGIGEETITTYRKRAYQRLGIATQRELLIWYLRNWSLGQSIASLARGPRAGTMLQ